MKLTRSNLRRKLKSVIDELDDLSLTELAYGILHDDEKLMGEINEFWLNSDEDKKLPSR